MNVKTLRWNFIRKRLLALFKNSFFWTLTLVGNSIVLVGAVVLYLFESGRPGGPPEFIDCLLWSTGTVTTVGYGNFEPLTLSGKITILFLMIAGTLFVWSYMAFLVTGLLAPELASLERDVHEVEKDVLEIRRKQEAPPAGKPKN